MSKIEILKSLKEHFPLLQKRYMVDGLYLFGSYARDEHTAFSDVDLLVEFSKTPDLLTFIELEEILSKYLNKNVDLVPKRKLKSELKNRILEEAIAV